MAASSALDKLFNNTGVTTFNMAVSPAVDKHFKPYWILWISSTEVDDTVPFLSTREIFEDHIRAQALPNTELDIRVDVHRINCDNPSTGNQAGEIVKTIGICRFNQMTQAARAWESYNYRALSVHLFQNFENTDGFWDVLLHCNCPGGRHGKYEGLVRGLIRQPLPREVLTFIPPTQLHHIPPVPVPATTVPYEAPKHGMPERFICLSGLPLDSNPRHIAELLSWAKLDGDGHLTMKWNRRVPVPTGGTSCVELDMETAWDASRALYAFRDPNARCNGEKIMGVRLGTWCFPVPDPVTPVVPYQRPGSFRPEQWIVISGLPHGCKARDVRYLLQSVGGFDIIFPDATQWKTVTTLSEIGPITSMQVQVRMVNEREAHNAVVALRRPHVRCMGMPIEVWKLGTLESHVPGPVAPPTAPVSDPVASPTAPVSDLVAPPTTPVPDPVVPPTAPVRDPVAPPTASIRRPVSPVIADGSSLKVRGAEK